MQKYGWGYMDNYMALKPNFIQGHLGVARSVAAGMNTATFDATSTAAELKRTGQPSPFSRKPNCWNRKTSQRLGMSS